MDRRGFLTAGAAGLTTALGGCLDGGDGTGTESGADGIQLESLDVFGSPGGLISIRPPEKVVLLDFFATWCAPCKPEMANLRAAREQFSQETVFIISITQETDTEAIEQFWNEYDGAWPVAMDTDLEATREYNVSGIPTILILTPDGTEVLRHTGLAGEQKLITNLEDAVKLADLD